MPDKPKLGLYWCASCGGCEESVVDLAEGILDVVAAVDIVFWPVAMDFKKADVEAMDDGSIAATLINGCVRTSEQEEMVRLLRRKSAAITGSACPRLTFTSPVPPRRTPHAGSWTRRIRCARNRRVVPHRRKSSGSDAPRYPAR